MSKIYQYISQILGGPQEGRELFTELDVAGRLWALIIGVNDYEGPRLHRLFGAENDANRFDAYLREHLLVPAGRITKLLGAQATRSAILKHFRALQLNPDIHSGDAIVIFYAGHGGESPVPAGWHTSGHMVQVIFSVDAGTKDKFGNIIHPIPDRTIAVLLNDLSNAKGDNITVVMDCCHSASSTRTDLFRGRIPRMGIGLQVEVPSILDREILANVDPELVLSFKFAHHALRSHTLLAACGVNELAFEHKGTGSFTDQLIGALVTYGTKDLTYNDLMRKLPPLPDQNPQCEGIHANRVLFNNKLESSAVFVEVEQHGDGYKMKSGVAQGIIVGSQYSIHRGHLLDDESNPALFEARVVATAIFTSTLVPLTPGLAQLPEQGYACLRSIGPGQELCVYLAPEVELALRESVVWAERIGSTESSPGFRFTLESDADLCLDIGLSGELSFKIRHPVINFYGLSKLPHTVPLGPEPQNLISILDSMAMWKWHLKRHNSSKPLQGLVDLQVYQLYEEISNLNGDPIPTLNPGGINLVQDAVVQILVHPQCRFGVKLVNNSTRDLYPFLFYFDTCTQEILPIYNCYTSSSEVDCPLPGGKELTIGFGDGGVPPLAYDLPPDVDINVAFLKLFLAASPAVFSTISQMSPFGIPRGNVPKSIILNALSKQEIWDCEMVTLWLRRQHPTPTEHIPWNEFRPLHSLSNKPPALPQQPTLLELPTFSLRDPPHAQIPEWVPNPAQPVVVPQDHPQNRPMYRPIYPPDMAIPVYSLPRPTIVNGGGAPDYPEPKGYLQPLPPIPLAPQFSAPITGGTSTPAGHFVQAVTQGGMIPQVGFDGIEHAAKTISRIHLTADQYLCSITVHYSDRTFVSYGPETPTSHHDFILHPGTFNRLFSDQYTG